MSEKLPLDDAIAFYGMLKILMKKPCLLLMLGEWETGKTDTSLLIGHLALKWGLIDKIGSNIFTFENPMVDYVNSFGRLKRWLHYDRLTKLYIFDEALQHLPSRRAMSRKNVDVMGLVTELSKAHGRIIFCAQTEKVDSNLLDTEFLRCVFTKYVSKEDGFSMICGSRLFKPVTFTHLPKSPILFDKDRLAEFWEAEAIQYSDLSEEMKVGKARMEGKSFSWIRDNLDVHPETAKRHVRKLLKAFFEQQKIEVVNH